MQINVIMNPVAGKGRTIKSLPRVKRVLNRYDLEFQVYRTDYPGHATELASKLEERGDLLVAMGGDGTVREVVNGMKSANSKLGIIPSGMGNDLSRSLKIPASIEQASQLLLEGVGMKIDLGLEDGSLFSVMGIGFPAEVVETYRTMRNGFFKGSLIYLVSVLRSLSTLKTYRIVMDVDGQSRQYDACAIFVMSSGFTGGGINLVPHADLTDSLLDVAIIHEVGKVELALTLQKAYKGQHVDHPKIEFLRAKSVVIKPSKRMVKMIDGDLEGNTPVSIKVAPQARTVIIPNEN